MNRRGGRTAVWLWGAIFLTAMLFAGVRLLPGIPVGDVDPLGAAIGLGVGLPSLCLAALALRPPALTLAEAVDQLAGMVAERERTARRQLLGDHDQIIDVALELRPAPAHTAVGARRYALMSEVVDYYRGLDAGRLVITGAPGAGKTVLAVELILGMLAARDSGQAVPVRISAASLNTDPEASSAVEQWLRGHLMQVYRLPEATARALVMVRRVIPVIDGLDEMDSGEEPGYNSRARRVLDAINAYQDQHARAKGAVVLTCRTVQYEALEELRIWARDAARVEIAPVDRRLTRNFLAVEASDPARWEPVLQAIANSPEGPLAEGLSTPWRLSLAATVYDQRDSGDPAGAFVRDPVELVEIAVTPEGVRDHLLSLLIPSTLARTTPPGTADNERTHQWLAVLASYLDANARSDRASIRGRVLSGTDMILHELWPLVGNRARILSAVVVATTSFACMTVWLAWAAAVGGLIGPVQSVLVAIAVAIAFAYGEWGTYWPKPHQADLRRLRTPAGRRALTARLKGKLAFALVVSPIFGLVSWPLARVFGAFEGLTPWLAACMSLGLVMALMAGLTVPGPGDFSDPRDPVRADAAFGLAVGLAAGLTLGLMVGLGLGVRTQPWGRLTDVLKSELVIAPTYCLALGLTVASAWLRYVALLACTRRWGKVWLPWRLGRFLNWAYEARLLRIAGIAYQFRHRELQDYLATHPVPDPAAERP